MPLGQEAGSVPSTGQVRPGPSMPCASLGSSVRAATPSSSICAARAGRDRPPEYRRGQRPDGGCHSILDAAEALLIAEGQRAVTTRRLSEQAGVNHGLVHYYFGSMDEVMMQTFERFTARLIVRQRTMYAADVPFLQKWRMAMSYLDEDLAAGYPKVWIELQALGWNRPEMRERVAAMTARVARRPHRRVWQSSGRISPRSRPVSGRGIGEPGDDLQPGAVARAPVRDFRRPSRATRLGRRLAGSPGGGNEPNRAAPATRTRGIRRARRRQDLLRGAMATVGRRFCYCRPGRSSTRGAGRCRFLTWRATYRVVTFDPRGNGRSDRPIRVRMPTASGSSRPMRWRCWTPPVATAPSSLASPWARNAACCWPPSIRAA